MSARPKFAAYTREEVAYRNAIAQCAMPLKVTLAGAEWTLELSPTAVAPDAGAERVEADWGGARLGLRLPAAAVGRLLRGILPDADPAALPQALKLAALEVVRGEAERAFAPKGGARPLRLRGVADGPARHRFALRLANAASGETITGELDTDVLGLGFGAPLVRAASPASAPAAAWLEALPLPVRFDLGFTVLPVSELAALRPHDVILLDESHLGADAGLAVMVGPRLGFRGRLDGRTFETTQPLGKIMAEPTAAAPAGAKTANVDPDAIEQVPVRLTFDLGERSLTVAELRALKPGFTFDLGRDVRRAVTIRANGQPVGEGELVDIDGILGVAVTSLGARS